MKSPQTLIWKSMCQPTKQNFKMCCVIVTVFLVYYGYLIYKDKTVHFYRNAGFETPCEIPEVDPFDPEMMKYIWRPEPLQCHMNPTSVVFIDGNNILKFNLSVLSDLDETETSVKCVYHLIIRSKEEYMADTEVSFSEPISFVPPINIQADYFRVLCKNSWGKTIFDNVLTKVLKSNRTLSMVNIGKDKYNLMLFGMDSVSRASAIRQLPNTFKYLTKELNAVDFKGYTKVQDNTFPNIIPLLTGFVAYSDEIPKIDFLKEYLDNYPFIWKNFSSKGYATMFAEDLPNLGMFNLEKLGFKNYPTDHLMRPYWLGNYKLVPLHNFVTHVQRVLKNSNLKVAPSALCNGNEPNHVTVLNYLKQFMLTYRNELKFMFSFLTELAHEFQNFLNLGDNDIRDFFKWMKENGFLDDTIVIVFSDHGLKFGNNQHLFTARLESRLPWLNIILPETLRNRYPNMYKNMITNQNRLASTFDLHATIRDVLNSEYGDPTNFYVRGEVRGKSLFQEIDADRSCKDANIGDSYCACYKSEPVNVTDNDAIEVMATTAVQHINDIVKKEPNCVTLTLNSTISARKVSQGLTRAGVFRKHNLWVTFHVPEAEERDDTKYLLVITTTPGGAQFFVTCSYNGSTGEARVIGNVDRINKYGNQSHCTHSFQLRPYCLCKDMV